MIECGNCETAQFLQITRSRVTFRDGQTINELSETYECTLCGATGSYSYAEGADPQITGEVAISTERPNLV